MKKHAFIQTILGENFTKAREKQGLSTADLAIMAILSESQIEQIENGGSKSFYTAALKIQSAKKVAKILGLSDQETFEFKDKKDSQQLSLQLPAIEPSEPIEVLNANLEEKGQINLAANNESKQVLNVKKKFSAELGKVSSINTHLEEVIATAKTDRDHRRQKTTSYFKVFACLGSAVAVAFFFTQYNHQSKVVKINPSNAAAPVSENREPNQAEVVKDMEPTKIIKVLP
jgi:transcriptional regulator with XRE-family HTH domain